MSFSYGPGDRGKMISITVDRDQIRLTRFFIPRSFIAFLDLGVSDVLVEDKVKRRQIVPKSFASPY